jgi:hypothetical protein
LIRNKNGKEKPNANKKVGQTETKEDKKTRNGKEAEHS